MICYGMWSYTQPAGHVFFCQSVIWSEQQTQTVSGQPLVHCIITADSRSMTCSATHTRTHTPRVSPFAIITTVFRSLQAVVCEATYHQLNSSLYRIGAGDGLESRSPPTPLRRWARHAGSLTRRRSPVGPLLWSAECWSWGGPGTQGSNKIHRFPSCGLWSVGPTRFQREATNKPSNIKSAQCLHGHQRGRDLELQEDPWCSLKSRAQW